MIFVNLHFSLVRLVPSSTDSTKVEGVWSHMGLLWEGAPCAEGLMPPNAGEGLASYSLAAKIVCCVYLALLWLAAPSLPLQEGLTCRHNRTSNFRVACGCHGNTYSQSVV